MRSRLLGAVMLMFLGRTIAEGGQRGEEVASDVCSKLSLLDNLLHFYSSSSSISVADEEGQDRRAVSISVEEGDEVALRKAMYLVHKNRGDYAALLFYASWCPFSKDCRSNFTILQSLFPRIHHFAFEESAIRPRFVGRRLIFEKFLMKFDRHFFWCSVLSRYGVHGFPTLFLLNSTMRIRYHGHRTTNLLMTFYQDVSGNKPSSVDPLSLKGRAHPSCEWDSGGGEDPQNCPFSWARSPEKLLQQDAYLALATLFVIFRLLHFLWPKLVSCCGCAWTRHSRNANLRHLSRACFERGKQACAALNPYKPKNRDGGARNACAWASQSLAPVSIGEASSGRVFSGRESR